MYNYYFAAASKSFFLDQEPIEEILRERLNYYKTFNKEIDFWFILDPKFSNITDKFSNTRNPEKSLAAIVSLDQEFIKWLKLRTVFVKIGNFQSTSIFLNSSDIQ